MENRFEDFMSDKEWNERLNTLTEKQKLYFQMMLPQQGVLYIMSRPGIAKSATARAIASKMGMRYMDLRLSMVDETDVGLYPNVGKMEMINENGNAVDIDVLKHVVPEWAVKANQVPTIIHFEELNRASLHVRNAALQLLLEREIGTEFAFNSNVFMISSGNLGDEDGTDVEDFDTALNNRLIAFEHTLDVKEWISDFAKENVCPEIVSYIKAHPGALLGDVHENCKSHATPRSWTFLSEFIFSLSGKWVEDKNGKKVREWGNTQQWIDTVTQVGRSYIGNDIVKFVRYCQDNISININDIMNNYKKHEKQIENFPSDRLSELATDCRDLKYNDLTTKQINNISKFLKNIQKEQLVGFLTYMVDQAQVNSSESVDGLKELLKNFKSELKMLKEETNNQ